MTAAVLRAFFVLAVFAPPFHAQTGWKQAIRKDHPRLFFNAQTLGAVKARALGPEAAHFERMKRRVDAEIAKSVSAADHGNRASEAAFVWLITGDKRYFDFAKALLETSLKYYLKCYQEMRAVDWYSFSRISAIAAYDWLFPSLTPGERRQMALDILQMTEEVQPTKTRKAFTSPGGGRQRENWGGVTSGFYSTPSLLWYAGLATYREVEDPRAEQFLTRGYELQLQVLEHRGKIAGDDGGSAAGTLGYLLGAYPWAEFNFFHTFESATGENIAARWPYLTYLPGYIFWNWLPGAREFGYGDAHHRTNALPLGSLGIHLAQIVHFYGHSHREAAQFTRWLAARTPETQGGSFSWTRFLLTSGAEVEPARDPASRMPLARHFEHMGQIFFRSGSGPDDTYAMFSAGAASPQHKHFDNNNFVIFKKGFLALDTGARPEPGLHLSHYYARTVAHNCILIHMPGEIMPRYWGDNPAPGEERLPVPNDGGQNQVTGSRVIAFESAPQFAYVAGDATATYNPAKCRMAVRQFVFLPPDHFVILDRVVATQPQYEKTWLLHTAGEPDIRGAVFTARHEQGRLFSRTLLPEGARLGKIGGPGRQFWSGGRNWPLPKGFPEPDTNPLFGQWRVEVSPTSPRESDLFLHVLEAADAGARSMARVDLTRRDGMVGARIETPNGVWEVLFHTGGPPGGRIRLERGGIRALDRALSSGVQPQKGLYGTN